MFEGKSIIFELTKGLTTIKRNAIIAKYHPNIGITIIDEDHGEELFCMESNGSAEMERLESMINSGTVRIIVTRNPINPPLGRPVSTCPFTKEGKEPLAQELSQIQKEKDYARFNKSSPAL